MIYLHPSTSTQTLQFSHFNLNIENQDSSFVGLNDKLLLYILLSASLLINLSEIIVFIAHQPLNLSWILIVSYSSLVP